LFLIELHPPSFLSALPDTAPVQPKIDNQWYKLTKQVLSTCCHTLRSKVLNKMLTHDLSQFSFQLHRLNANGWDDLGDGSTSLQVRACVW
jgi:hypothetical protein